MWHSYRVQPPAVEDLAGWCREHCLESWVISPAQVQVRQPPVALGSETHLSFERRLRYEIDERLLVCLPDTRICGTNGLVVLPDGAFAVEAIYGRNHLDVDPAYVTPMPSRVIHKEGDYFSLVGKFSNFANYYHWVHDALLRLHGAEERLPADVKYLVPPVHHKFKRETLDLLGLHKDQLVTFAGDEPWECERLWFASLPPSGAEVPAAVTWFRERMYSATGTPPPEPERRFYISRRRAEYARVVNEDELVPVLEAHGFEITEPELMSVADQIRLFARAEVIVAPHGAGQTNMLFASPRCKNLELLEPQWASDGHAYVYWTLAQTIGQSFSYLVAETVTNPDHDGRANLHVPTAMLESALSQLT